MLETIDLQQVWFWTYPNTGLYAEFGKIACILGIFLQRYGETGFRLKPFSYAQVNPKQYQWRR